MVARVRSVEKPIHILSRPSPYRAHILYVSRIKLPQQTDLTGFIVISVCGEDALSRTAMSRTAQSAPDAPARQLFHERVRGPIAYDQHTRYDANRLQSLVCTPRRRTCDRG